MTREYTISPMIRSYKFKAFPPIDGAGAFDAASGLKKEMWADLCAMQKDYRKAVDPLFAAPKDQRDMAAISALKAERAGRIKTIRQTYAARGLAWGDYNSMIFQFEGAVRGCAKRKATPDPNDSATSPGLCVVRQIMGGAKYHHFFSRNDVWICNIPHKNSRITKPGSRRDGYRMTRMTFLIRTDRHEMGEAPLVLDYVENRKIPLDATVVEVRVIRRARPVINKNGKVFDRHEWWVVFVAKVPFRENGFKDRACGVALSWKADDGDDGCRLAVVSSPAGQKTYGFSQDHLDAWREAAMRKEALKELTDPEERRAREAELSILYKKLTEDRRIRLRTIAKEIVSSVGAVAVDATWLAIPGTKNHAAPATLRLEIKRAAGNAGCAFFEEKIKENDTHKRASLLRKKALELALNVVDQCDAA